MSPAPEAERPAAGSEPPPPAPEPPGSAPDAEPSAPTAELPEVGAEEHRQVASNTVAHITRSLNSSFLSATLMRHR